MRDVKRSLDFVRGQIDGIDLSIARLVEKRRGLVAEVRRFKANHGLPERDEARERVVRQNYAEVLCPKDAKCRGCAVRKSDAIARAVVEACR